MFEDVEDEFELDIINQRDSDDEEERKSATRRRLSKKMNFAQVKLAFNWSSLAGNVKHFLFVQLSPQQTLAASENERRYREGTARAIGARRVRKTKAFVSQELVSGHETFTANRARGGWAISSLRTDPTTYSICEFHRSK